jgi:hypothetical protein
VKKLYICLCTARDIRAARPSEFRNEDPIVLGEVAWELRHGDTLDLVDEQPLLFKRDGGHPYPFGLNLFV